MHANEYIRAIQWILHYYYRGVPSWGWYYPYHYAPYITDIKNFQQLDYTFDLGHPFLPYQQLLAVLPPTSKQLLPNAYRGLMTEADSEILEYYPEKFDTDMNGKKQEWEALVLIPFIDEQLLLQAMARCDRDLVAAEQARNKHGPMTSFKYTDTNMGTVEGILKLPAVQNCFCEQRKITLDEIRVPISRMVFGPPKGALYDVYFPGFPTMKFLEYSVRFGVNVAEA